MGSRLYLVDENLVTALVPSEIACLESCIAVHLVSILASGDGRRSKELTSPGRMRRTEVWISRDEMVDFLFCWQVEQYVSHREVNPSLFEASATYVRSELRGLRGDALKDVVDERVEDEHGLVRDTSVRVDLLEDLRRREEQQGVSRPVVKRSTQPPPIRTHLVDVGRVGLLAGLALALLVVAAGRGLLDGLLGGGLAGRGLGGGSLASG